MPSKKPQFVIRTDQEVLDKIAYIAKENERNTTQEIVYLLKQKIKAYEAEHGEIILPEKPVKAESNAKNTAIKVLKTVTGVSAGEALGDIIIDHMKSKEDE